VRESNIPVITIDGASGTGKGVVCHHIAARLNWHLLDSGVLYRVLALAAEQKGLSLEDEIALDALAKTLPVLFKTHHVSDPPRIFLENTEVTDTIRTEAIGNAASKIGALPLVRKALLDRQRAFRTPPGLVTDGRDMGTVIFPDAIVKIFLVASPEERAKRRYLQLKASPRCSCY
jgi:cytidylate kinase